MQSLIPYTIRDELVIKDSVKIFFWNLHPENLVPNFVPIISVNNIITANYKFFKKYIDLIFNKRITNARNFLELCLNKKSLVFMDKTNLYNTCYKLNFSQDKKINFLPVPVNIKNRILKKKNKKNISISWVGRVEGIKYNILLFILFEISNYCLVNKFKVKFHLIGDGKKLNIIKNSLFENQFFSMKIYGNISYSNLEEFLQKEIDLSFAMGTSAMDSAKFGIPTILVDYSYKIIKNYKFRWIFDTEFYDLTHDINNNDYSGKSYSLIEIMKQLSIDYKILSKKSKDYVIENHNLKTISNDFLFLLSKSELTFGDLNKEILHTSFLRKTYYKFNKYYTGTK